MAIAYEVEDVTLQFGNGPCIYNNNGRISRLQQIYFLDWLTFSSGKGLLAPEMLQKPDKNAR